VGVGTASDAAAGAGAAHRPTNGDADRAASHVNGDAIHTATHHAATHPAATYHAATHDAATHHAATYHAANGDGRADHAASSANGDGNADHTASSANGDGRADYTAASPANSGTTCAAGRRAAGLTAGAAGRVCQPAGANAPYRQRLDDRGAGVGTGLDLDRRGSHASPTVARRKVATRSRHDGNAFSLSLLPVESGFPMLVKETPCSCGTPLRMQM